MGRHNAKQLNRNGESDTVDVLFLSREVVRDLHRSYLQQGGVEYLSKLAQENPRVYAGLLSKIIPQVVIADVQQTVNIGDALAQAHKRVMDQTAQTIDAAPAIKPGAIDVESE